MANSAKEQRYEDQINPEFLKIKSELTSLMKSSKQPETIQGKIEAILSNEDHFIRLFTGK